MRLQTLPYEFKRPLEAENQKNLILQKKLNETQSNSPNSTHKISHQKVKNV